MQNPQIYVGPAGWSYPDWKGIFYPLKFAPGETELSYLAQYFNLVEINSTFYRIPTQAMVENWLKQVQSFPAFRFTCKMWQNFTHQIESPNPEAIQQFKAALMPIQDQQRLLTLLLQFPWSFKNNTPNRKRLMDLFSQFSEFPLALEVRHSSWEQSAFWAFLNEQNVAFVNIDQPVIGQSIGFTTWVTTNLAYFRMHGRNTGNWFNPDANRNSRYDYLYSAEEQNFFSEKIIPCVKTASTVVIVYNNHYRGQAVTNSFQMKFKLEQQPQHIPESLTRFYPALNMIKRKFTIGENFDLFQTDDPTDTNA
ncbi:DUF72 domain-containing protein [candidate division KSB1 bacterium]|nr:DUF72 domain-containing protein [candidate division KSB1 bacterium]